MGLQQSSLTKLIVAAAILMVAGCASTKEPSENRRNPLRGLNPFVSDTQKDTAGETVEASEDDAGLSRKERRQQARAERRAARQAKKAERQAQKRERLEARNASYQAWLENSRNTRLQRQADRVERRETKRQAIAAGAIMDGVYMEGTPTAERYPFYQRPGDEGQRSDKLKRRAWKELLNYTEVRLIGDNRIRIDVKSPYIMSVEDMEYILLGRAAGETARAGFREFSIVYARYHGGEGLSSLLLPEVSFGATNDWIGSYEDLVRNREDQRLSGRYNRIGGKRIEAVIRLVEDGESRRRETFAADDLYLNMLNERLFGGEFPYR